MRRDAGQADETGRPDGRAGRIQRHLAQRQGAGLFHRFGVRCFGVNESGSPAAVSRGVCTDVDPDGDQIFSSYETRVVDGRTAGVHTFTGGTGKYAGFSGKAEFSVVPVKSADGSALMSVPHKANWRLP